MINEEYTYDDGYGEESVFGASDGDTTGNVGGGSFENGEENGEEEETVTGGAGGDSVTGGDSVGGGDSVVGGGDTVTGGTDSGTTVESSTVITDSMGSTDTILNPAYVEKVKSTTFGSLYTRLTSDEKESQCAEFLAPQLVKQDRLFKHSFNAAFGPV